MKEGFNGESFTINDTDSSLNPSSEYDLTRVNSRNGNSLGEDVIHYGGNSGYQAVNLAYLLGAKTIILLGFDMFGTHYFGNHPANLNNGSPYKRFIEAFETINPKKHGIEIINCSRQTALECFPRTTIESVL